MKGKKEQEWLEKGYQMISESGFASVYIASIARVLSKSKSPFYRYLLGSQAQAAFNIEV